MKADDDATIRYLEYDLNITEGCSPHSCVWFDSQGLVLDKRTPVIDLSATLKDRRIVFLLLKCQLKRGRNAFPTFHPREKVEFETYQFEERLNYQSRTYITKTKQVVLGFTVRVSNISDGEVI